ncbi:acyl-homoserine-lactone synthase [Paraburkholderia fungorum]|uniref:acyl-homoserine-lactone synthase n=1 Tax=Paraburkholderia fungorum TaxID=134537 RepID=UPI0015CD0F5F
MEEIVFTTMDKLSPRERQQLGRYRHTVFVQQLQWDLPLVGPGTIEEWDEFDRGNTVCVIAYTKGRSICGYARLLPTTRPYLLSEVFPDLCSIPLISDSFTWELSRFTTFDNGVDCSIPGIRELLRFIFIRSQSLGIRQLVGVAPSSMDRLYRRLGLVLRPIGPAQTGKNGLAAFSLDINTAGLRALSDEHKCSSNFSPIQASCEPSISLSRADDISHGGKISTVATIAVAWPPI